MGQKIGILGGSFNPAHKGHMGISLSALKHLDLDCVWWLVTPQNPHKIADEYAPLSDRIQYAYNMAVEYNIVVKDIETSLKSTYTIDVIQFVQCMYTDTRFIWLMGADNLVNFHTWHRWQDIAHAVPIAVFARPNTDVNALQNSPCCDMLQQVAPCDIWQHIPNIWTFISDTQFMECATDIRNQQKQKKL